MPINQVLHMIAMALLVINTRLTGCHSLTMNSRTAACVRQCTIQSSRTSTPTSCRGSQCYTQQQQQQQQRHQTQQQYNQQSSSRQGYTNQQSQNRQSSTTPSQYNQQSRQGYNNQQPQQRHAPTRPSSSQGMLNDAMMQNLTATLANALSNKINVHVTHDYMTMSSKNPIKSDSERDSYSNKNAEPDKNMPNPHHVHSNNYAQDCSDLATQGHNKSGIYTIRPEVMPVSSSDDEIEPFEVYCDMDTDGGGGWTVFQRRYNGLVNFYRNWEDYKKGFGYLMGDYWLGLERMHRMTAIANYELRVDLQDVYGNGGWATYDNFQIGDEGTFYKLIVGEYDGTAGDSLTYHNNMAFSTKDKDNDKHQTSHCAQQYKGAWWYKECFRSNLNGEYLQSLSDRGVMNWYDTNDAIKKSEMKIRRAKVA